MIFFKHDYSDTTESVVDFNALDGETNLGKCTLVMDGMYAEVTDLSFDRSNPFVVEGLLKAAFNLAANQNCYIGRCRISEISVFLDRMNFICTDGMYENDIPSILMGSCNSCRNNQ